MDIFICYSRRDARNVAMQLSFSLGQMGFSTLVDAEGIPTSDNFWVEIQAGILESDIFLFVITEQALISPYLHMELLFARRHSKRIITVSEEQVDTIDLINSAHHNVIKQFSNNNFNSTKFSNLTDISIRDIDDNFGYLQFVRHYALASEVGSYDRDINALASVIREEQIPAQLHTQLLTQATKWNTNGRNPDNLLRGQELRNAVQWIHSVDINSIPPTPLQIAYINASHRTNGKSLIEKWMRRLGISQNDRIFISYRRDDSKEVSAALYGKLIQHFGKVRVFFDTRTIPVGADFAEKISETLNRCSVFLVVIGQEWVSTEDEHGKKRLENPKDWVRLEVTTALQNPDIVVIPILVNHTAMPRQTDLPDLLRELTYRNAMTIRNDHHFSDDVQELIDVVEGARKLI